MLGAGYASGFIARPTGTAYVTYESLNPTGTLSFRQVVGNVPSGKILTLPEGTFTVSDFSQGYLSGLIVPATCAGIIGSGSGTIFQMVPGSSTKASSVPTADFEENECHLMDINLTHGFLLKNLTVKGTNQGHPYNGVRIGNGTLTNLNNVTIDNVLFSGCAPGYSNFPPGETFMLDTNWTTNTRILNCEFDGRTPWNGAIGCPSQIGYNNSTNCYLENVYAHHAISGGPTFWRCTNVHTINLRSELNGTGGSGDIQTGAMDSILNGWGVNHENVSGSILHENPILKPGTHAAAHMQVMNYDGTHARANPVQFTNVTHDGVVIKAFIQGAQFGTPWPAVTKNGVTLTARNTDVSGFASPNGATEYFVVH